MTQIGMRINDYDILLAIAAIGVVALAFVFFEPVLATAGDYTITKVGANYVAKSSVLNTVISQSPNFHAVWNDVIARTDSKRIFLSSITYQVAGNLDGKNGLTVNGKGATLAIGSDVYAMLGTVASNQNLTFRNMVYDFQSVGQSLFIPGDQTNPSRNILFDNVDFVNVGSTWGLHIDFNYPAFAPPTVQNDNIRIINCEVTSPNGSGTLENVLIANSKNVLIKNCNFKNTVGSKPAALSIYGGSSGVEIKESTFENNPGGAMYIQQSKNVNVHHSRIQNEIKIFDSRIVKIHHNALLGTVRIIDFDGPTFDGHPSKYRGSKNIAITDNPNVLANEYFVYITTQHNLQNMPKNISVARNIVLDTLRGLVIVRNMPTSADYIDYLTISGNEVHSNYAFLGSDIIVLEGNTANPHVGINHITITGNFFGVSKNGVAPWDVNIGPGHTTVSVTNNDFNNKGISYTTGYEVSGNY